MTEHGDSSPLEVDDYSDQPGGFVQQWWVPPPRHGQMFQVTHEAWEPWGTTMVRRIYGWKPAPKGAGAVLPLMHMRRRRWRRRLSRLIAMFTD